MANITVTVPDKMKNEMEGFEDINWSAVSRLAFAEKLEQLAMLKKLNSKEEQDFILWSVEAGENSKKKAWQKLIASLTAEERREILKNARK